MKTLSPTRLTELRNMPYEEYLLTPEWLATRRRILKRDDYTCQGCRATSVVLHVHHWTYERLGEELDDDLITICKICHDEIHGISHLPAVPFGHKVGLFGGTAVFGTIGLEAILHAPLPAEIGMLVGAYFLAKNSPALLSSLKASVPPELLAWLGIGNERRAGEYSVIERWTGKPMRDQQATIHRLEEHQVEAELERMRDGNKQEEDGTDDDEDGDDAFSLDDDDDEIVFSFEQHEGIRVFSDLLKTGWRPSMEQIYVGTDERGKHLFVPVRSLWHIALAGASGYGKSSLLRLIMVQLCYLKLPVVLLNPHYMIYDRDHNEDWTPYTPYLKRDPMVCCDMAHIETMLRWMVGELLEKRKERAARGEGAGKPFFFILDEFPDIKAEIKDAPTLIGKLLRQGRKYGIYLVIASQDYSVKTLGVEGEGSLRKCFRTIFYVGGDPVSVKELLNKAVKDIPENTLGQGTIMLKCKTVSDPIVASIPYLDNESLYLLLGPSTFVAKGQEEVHTDELSEVNVTVTSSSESAQISPKSAEHIDVTVTSPARDGELETASEQGGTGQNDNVILPTGWTEKKLDMLPGFYRVLGNLDKSLEAIEVSVTQRNRDYARDILKKLGLWKGQN